MSHSSNYYILDIHRYELVIRPFEIYHVSFHTVPKVGKSKESIQTILFRFPGFIRDTITTDLISSNVNFFYVKQLSISC
jgi:hypothetical protein